MNPLFLLWAAGTAAAFVLSVLILRGAFRLSRRMRVNTVWGAAAELTGLTLAPMTRKAGPELRGDYEGRDATVSMLPAERPRSGKLTRVAVRLRLGSPLRLRVRRESSLSLLGQLARVGFRPDRLDDSDVFHVEGDRELFRRVLARELRGLFVSEDEWAFVLSEEEAALTRPGIARSAEKLQDELHLLSKVADLVEEAAAQAGQGPAPG